MHGGDEYESHASLSETCLRYVATFVWNALVICYCLFIAEMPDRSMAATYSPSLPLSTKDKESKSRGEQYNLLNGGIEHGKA